MASLKQLPPGCDPVRIKLNKLAQKFYASCGYVVAELPPHIAWDFENSSHPQEESMFVLALHAWEFFHGDEPDYDQEDDHQPPTDEEQ